MKLCSKILAIAVIAAATYSLIGCGAPQTYSYSNVSVTLESRCSDCQGGQGSANNIFFDPNNPGVEFMPNAGEGGNVLLTAVVNNAPPNVSWAIYPTNDINQPNPVPTCTATGSACAPGEASPAGQTGYFIVQSSNTAIYENGITNAHTSNATASVPIYSGALLAQAQSMKYVITYPSTTFNTVTGQVVPITISEPVTGIPQGDVLIAASVPNDPDNPSSVTTAYQLMEYYNENSVNSPSLYLVPQTPTSPTGLTTSVLTVPVGTQYQFFGGAAGDQPCFSTSGCNGIAYHAADNGVIWLVGGSSTASSCPTVAVAGGSTAYGTISSSGLYTAPATVPAGINLCVVMAAHAAPSSLITAYITVQ